MLKSRWSMVLGILPLVGALAGLSGCEQPGTDDGGTDSAAAELAGTPARGPKGEKGAKGAMGERGMHGRGPGMLLGAALHELDLTDAQKTTIQGELDALKADGGPKVDNEAARKAVAEAVRNGKVDEAALLAQFGKPQIDTSRFAKAIGVLHDTLSAAQRKELVEKVSARMNKFGGPEGRPDWKERGAKDGADGRGAKGARGDFGPNDQRGHGPKGERGDRGANGQNGDGPQGERGPNGERGPKGERGGHGPGMHGPLGYLLRGIELTDSQREAVRTAMEKTAPSETDRAAMKTAHEAMKTAMKDRLATFASDSFDANAFVKPAEGAPNMGPQAMFGHMLKVVAAVTPVLDETQRAELAKRIEEAPMGPPHMGKGPRGPQQDQE